MKQNLLIPLSHITLLGFFSQMTFFAVRQKILLIYLYWKVLQMGTPTTLFSRVMSCSRPFSALFKWSQFGGGVLQCLFHIRFQVENSLIIGLKLSCLSLLHWSLSQDPLLACVVLTHLFKCPAFDCIPQSFNFSGFSSLCSRSNLLSCTFPVENCTNWWCPIIAVDMETS